MHTYGVKEGLCILVWGKGGIMHNFGGKEGLCIIVG